MLTGAPLRHMTGIMHIRPCQNARMNGEPASHSAFTASAFRISHRLVA